MLESRLSRKKESCGDALFETNGETFLEMAARTCRDGEAAVTEFSGELRAETRGEEVGRTRGEPRGDALFETAATTLAELARTERASSPSPSCPGRRAIVPDGPGC